ncbi:MAG: YwaF family protein, partial [Clostridia bacterium]|nr:YwaF family protein [Clostridia bacterium]
AVLTSISEEAGVFRLEQGEGSDILLRAREGYLTSADTGNGLYFSETPVPCSQWRFEEECLVYNPNSAYTSGGTVYRNDYLEYYPNSNFYSTYGRNSGSDPGLFKMSFFRLTAEGRAARSAAGYRLAVFETSDIHGYIADTSSGEYQYRLAYIADKVKDVRGYGDAYRIEKAILLDGGDIYQGNTLSNLTEGSSVSAAFELMDYDAVTVGNHEFDWDIENTVDADGTMIDYELSGSVRVNDVPIVVSNMYLNGQKVPFASDYVILEKTAVDDAGNELTVRVAVIGFASDYASSIMYARFTGSGYSVNEDYAALNRLAAELERSGQCDATIMLTHGESSAAASALGSASVIDLVLGGHTHQNQCGETFWGLRYLQPSGNGSAYVYSELVFNIDDAGKPVFAKVTAARNVALTQQPEKLYDRPANAQDLDPELVSLTNIYIDSIGDALEETVGTITVSADRYTALPDSGGRSTTAGNWMASLLARSVDAQIGFVNSGGIRTEFYTRADGKREITVSDVYALFPFSNKVYCFELTGAELLRLFEYALTESGGSLLSRLCGIDCYYSGTSVNALVLDGEPLYAYGRWAAGAQARKYRVAVSDYVATSNRTANGMDNPLVAWSATERLVSSELVDNEAALAVLRAEAKANNGQLFIDTHSYYINKPYDGELPGSDVTDPENNDPAKAGQTRRGTGDNNMFSTKHIILLAACVVVCTLMCIFLRKLSLKKWFRLLMYVGIVSETIKVFYYILDNEKLYGGYLPKTDLPFHLCSVQLIFIALLNFTKSEKLHRTLMAFMLPTCLVGGFAAILIPTSSSLHSPFITFQYFTYHTVIVAFAICLLLKSKEIGWTVKDYTTALKMLAFMGFVAIYINSMVYDVVEYNVAETGEKTV